MACELINKQNNLDPLDCAFSCFWLSCIKEILIKKTCDIVLTTTDPQWQVVPELLL